MRFFSPAFDTKLSPGEKIVTINGRAFSPATLQRALTEAVGTDRLDLWQIHEVIYENDPALHFAKGGAVEALDDAKRQGKVRFVGFTGHKSPAIHLAGRAAAEREHCARLQTADVSGDACAP